MEPYYLLLQKLLIRKNQWLNGHQQQLKIQASLKKIKMEYIFKNDLTFFLSKNPLKSKDEF